MIFTTATKNAHKIGILVFLFVASCNFDKTKDFSFYGLLIAFLHSAQETIDDLSMQIKAERDNNVNLDEINKLLQGLCGTASIAPNIERTLGSTSVELPKLMQQ